MILSETLNKNVTNIDDDSDNQDNVPHANKRKRQPNKPKTYYWKIGKDGKKKDMGDVSIALKILKSIQHVMAHQVEENITLSAKVTQKT